MVELELELELVVELELELAVELELVVCYLHRLLVTERPGPSIRTHCFYWSWAEPVVT